MNNFKIEKIPKSPAPFYIFLFYKCLEYNKSYNDY